MPVTFGETYTEQQAPKTPALGQLEKRTRPLFSMLVHPEAWEWHPKHKEWLPSLSQLKWDPGVQGVALDPRTNGVDVSAAEQYYRSKGFDVLHDGDARLAGVLPGGRFVAKFRCAPRGTAHGWIWEGFEKVRNQIIWETDDDTRVRVCKHLIAAGVVPPMSDRLKQMEIRRLEARVSRLSASSARNPSPSIAQRLRAAENLLADYRADYEGKAAASEACLEPGCDSPVRWSGRCTAHHKLWKAAQDEVEVANATP